MDKEPSVPLLHLAGRAEQTHLGVWVPKDGSLNADRKRWEQDPMLKQGIAAQAEEPH